MGSPKGGTPHEGGSRGCSPPPGQELSIWYRSLGGGGRTLSLVLLFQLDDFEADGARESLLFQIEGQEIPRL